MDKKHWDKLGFWSLGVLMFIATMIIIRWVIDFVTWSALDSGWAQAIGSMLALGIAIYVGERQHRSALQVLKTGENIALHRRLSCVLAILDEACEQLKKTTDLLLGEGRFEFIRENQTLSPNDLDLFILTSASDMFAKKPQFATIVEVIGSVPMHDLGDQVLVRALFTARDTLLRFDERLLWISENVDNPAVLSGAENSSRTANMFLKSARDDFEEAMNRMLGIGQLPS